MISTAASLETRSAGVSAGTGVSVTVRLFGILALLARQRSLQFELPNGSTICDVVDQLGARFGADFLMRILRVPGELHSHCALFVNGEQVDSLRNIVTADGAVAKISVILFMASEGG